MNKNLDIINTGVFLIIKAVIVAARFSGIVRKRSLKRLAAMEVDAKEKEIIFLRDMVEQLQMQVSILQKGVKKKQKNPRYTLREKLFILWQMGTFQIPRRRVTEYFGIARSTLYRWLHKIEDQQQTSIPANKTPIEIAVLIWQITKSNINWGRIRIANQLALLNIFISASTVRNILQRPKPRNTPTSFEIPREAQEKTESAPFLPGIQIMFGLSIPQWFFAGDFGQYMSML
jgi:transposase